MVKMFRKKSLISLQMTLGNDLTRLLVTYSITTGVKSNTSLSEYTRVDCGRPRIYPGVDPELYPRGRLRRLPEYTPPSQDLLPPLYCAYVMCLRLLESTPPSQNIPPFQQLWATLAYSC